MARRFTAWCVIVCLAVTCGCSDPTASQAPSSAPDQQCAGSEFTVDQFLGEWEEQDSPTTISLGPHGALKSDTDGVSDVGTWEFTRWQDTPAKDQQPDSAAATCVLWLHWANEPANQDLVYVPLKVSRQRIELSYVGRGNTLVWLRSPVSQ